MTAAAIALSLSPLIGLEVAIRSFTSPASLSRPAVDSDPLVNLEQTPPLFELDPHSGRWQIPESRRNFFRPASFAATKPAGTKRIFVLGASTVQGRPYETETA